VRKYRDAFAKCLGWTASYRNWRGYDERLWLQDLPWLADLSGARALFVDDVMETGSSLEACTSLLASAHIATVGAMYLFDVSEPGVRERFDFPIRSLLRLSDLRANSAPALSPLHDIPERKHAKR
jgi:adenine/guanine phosphoribosyltransferase-like PRPP-binding protein